jgi:integrase
MGRGYSGIWKRAGRPNWFAWVNGKQVNLGTPNEKKALQKWHKLSGTAPERPKASQVFVVTLLNQFLRHLADDGRSDFGWYRSRIKSFAASINARLLLSDLRPSHVREWVNAKDWSPTHKNGSISAVQRALNWHVKDGSIKSNPIARVEKPERRKRKFIFSPEQLSSLLVALKEPARTFVALIAHTGCRPIELASANGTDVAPDGATIAVTRLKTDQDGPMPVPSSLRPWVLRLAVKAGGGPLCLTERGRRWSRKTWALAIRSVRKQAGLDPVAVAYALRHTWITERLDEGESVADVATATRTSIAMISSVYDKGRKERTRRLADRLK